MGFKNTINIRNPIRVYTITRTIFKILKNNNVKSSINYKKSSWGCPFITNLDINIKPKLDFDDNCTIDSISRELDGLKRYTDHCCKWAKRKQRIK